MAPILFSRLLGIMGSFFDVILCSSSFMGPMYGTFLVKYKKKLTLEQLYSYMYFYSISFLHRKFRYHSNSVCTEFLP